MNNNMIRGINYIDSIHYECGMIEDRFDNIYVCDINSMLVFPAPKDLKDSPYIKFSFVYGMYTLLDQCSNIADYTVKRQHTYPYQNIKRLYGAASHLNLFTKSSNAYLKGKKIPHVALSDYCPFTFGIEYETATGVIPEDDCFNTGLIPLRDGSITGNEYTTTILEGDKGLYLIDKHISLLNQYTDFNRDCSIHIHFGNYPLNKNAILTLNNLCSCLTGQLLTILPEYAFSTHNYKANGKDYCTPLRVYETFEQMYTNLTNMTFFGDFHQPHPNDPDKSAKWNIHSRYKMCNFINLLCYNGGKTVEFRFLKPTQNKHVLYFWLYMLNAIMLYAIKYQHLSTREMLDIFPNLSLQDITNDVYPIEIARDLNLAIVELNIIKRNQYNCGDKCGELIHFQNNFKLSTNLI